MPKRKINKKKFFLRLLVVLTILAGVGLFFANRIVKKYGFEGISDFASTYFANRELASAVEAVQLKIEMKDSDYQFLADKRDEALNRGVQINIGDNYVPCEVSSADKKVTGEIRLKGHMTDHLEGDKWSYRVKTKEPILGMYRFSLQHPGTRNYVYEWVYHQLLAQEGIIHLNYDFLQVQLNDKDLGIYAIEEHFGQHVLEHNNRPKGAILRWNPGLYWEWRIDELNGNYLDEDYSSFSSSYAEPYDKGVVKKDPELIENYQKGAQLLEAFRRDSLITSEVFDVELMARFHAIIDLVGGHHSLDWSDVKFYYNSETKRIEPIGYESFSVRETERVAGQRLPNTYASPELNYHDKLFSDPVFFKAYIQSLERICDEEYINDFKHSIKGGLNEKLGIVSKEWPYRKFTFQPYFRNIDLIRNNLELPKPFHAFINSFNDSLVEISLAAVSDYPIEIVSYEINNGRPQQINDLILLPKTRDDYVQYESIYLKHSVDKIKGMFFNARIIGGNTIFKIEVNEFPSFQSTIQSDKNDELQSTLKDNPFVAFSKNEQCYYFKNKNVEIKDQYLIGKNETLRILPGQQIVFRENGNFLVKGEIEFNGDSNNQISIESYTKKAVVTMDNAKMHCSNLVLTRAERFLECIQSEIYIQRCVFADVSKDLMAASFSTINISKSNLGSVNCIGRFDQSSVNFNEVNAKKGEVCFKSNAAVVRLISCEFSDFEEFCEGNHISKIGVWSSIVKNMNNLGKLDNGSDFKTYASTYENCNGKFDLDQSTYEPLAVSSQDFSKSDISRIN